MSVETLDGLTVYLTGATPGMSKAEAAAVLSRAGAHVASSWSKRCDLLIVAPGKPGGAKIAQAEQWGVPLMTWDAAQSYAIGGAARRAQKLVDGDPDWHELGQTKRHQPVSARSGYVQVRPMKCKPADGKLPDGDFLYEPKWDGYRCIAHVFADGTVVLASGAGNEFVDYPHINEELSRVATVGPCVLDGELVILDANGVSSFEGIHRGDPSRAVFVVFDLLELDGENLRPSPLSRRRTMMHDLLAPLGSDVIAASATFATTDLGIPNVVWIDRPDELIEWAESYGVEGIVAKRSSSAYQEGARNSAWIKLKLRNEQEFVIVGYTKGEGARADTVGAFLLAYNDNTDANPVWWYCGKVGTGGTWDELEAIRSRLTRRSESPLVGTPRDRDVTWVEPDTVIQVAFQNWTADGVLWHPAIKGVREDKKATDVRREP